MPQLTALVYNHRDKTKTYFKIKVTMYELPGPAEWGKVRLSQQIVPTSQRSGPIVRRVLNPKFEASQYVFTYVGSFKWKFLGQREPEPPLDLKHGRQGVPSGWFFSGGNYYSWQQIPEAIVQMKDMDKREAAITRECWRGRQEIRDEQRLEAKKTGTLFRSTDQQRVYGPTWATTNLPWALKRASDLWDEIHQDHEKMMAKRIKVSKIGGS